MSSATPDPAGAVHTPGGSTEGDFQGFSTVKGAIRGDLDGVLYKRRINALENLVTEVVDKFKNFEVENKELKVIVVEIQKENVSLQGQGKFIHSEARE